MFDRSSMMRKRERQKWQNLSCTLMINFKPNRIYLQRDSSTFCGYSRWLFSIVSCGIVRDGGNLRDKWQHYANMYELNGYWMPLQMAMDRVLRLISKSSTKANFPLQRLNFSCRSWHQDRNFLCQCFWGEIFLHISNWQTFSLAYHRAKQLFWDQK